MADDLTLAQRVRAKHPGAYGDLSDAELENRVRAKYPGVYDGVRSTPVDEQEPEQSGGDGALATGGVLATMAAGVPLAKRAAEGVVSAGPALGKAVKRFAPAAGVFNLGQSALDVVTGQKSLGEAGVDAAKGEALRQVVKRAPAMLQRVAAPVAGMSAPFAAGGLAGLAGSAGFLGALQHDANRDVPMDYTKRNLTEDVARALGSAGATDVQMDDPNHPAFRPDDSATVSAGEPGGLTAALLRLMRGSR
jgi:hypothetical protein